MAESEFRRGWPALTSALLGNAIGVHSLPPYTIGLFMGPLEHEFGWARTSISAAITILTICGAISAPLVGIALGKLGAGVLIISGLGFGSMGYFALGTMGPSIYVFWIIMAAMALLGSGCGPVTLSHLLISNFDNRRGTALGIAMMGIGVSGAMAPFLLGPIVGEQGWRTAYLTLAAVMLGAIPVMLFLLVAAKKRMQARSFQGPDPEIPWKEPRFRRMFAAFFFAALASGGMVVHFVPMLIDGGYAAAQAAKFAALLGISLVIGRLLTGIVIDRVFAPMVAAVFMLVSALGFFALFLLGSAWMPFTAVFVGFTLGAELDLIAYLVSRYFLRALHARMVGVFYSAFLVGVAISPLAFSLLRDAFGSYAPCLLWAAALLGVSSALVRGLPPFPDAVERDGHG